MGKFKLGDVVVLKTLDEVLNRNPDYELRANECIYSYEIKNSYEINKLIATEKAVFYLDGETTAKIVSIVDEQKLLPNGAINAYTSYILRTMKDDYFTIVGDDLFTLKKA